jgi:hypothetical protein
VELKYFHNMRRTDMYKTTFAFRDGNDIELRFWDHGEAYETLLRYTSEFDERLLYGALEY